MVQIFCISTNIRMEYIWLFQTKAYIMGCNLKQSLKGYEGRNLRIKKHLRLCKKEDISYMQWWHAKLEGLDESQGSRPFVNKLELLQLEPKTRRLRFVLRVPAGLVSPHASTASMFGLIGVQNKPDQACTSVRTPTTTHPLVDCIFDAFNNVQHKQQYRSN